MALSKSGKAGSNVSKMDDARKRRTKSSSSPKSAAAEDDAEQPPLAPQKVEAEAEADKPAPKARPKVSNRRFDTVKVERLKSEIASGAYKINYLNVADKFIEHERYA